MRVTANHFGVNRFDDVGDGEGAGFFGEDGMKDDLKEQVAKFGGKVVRVAGFHGVEDFVGFLDQKFAQRCVGLLAVPGAAAGSAQARLQRDQLFEPFSGALVAGSDWNFRAAIVAPPRRNFSGALGNSWRCFS